MFLLCQPIECIWIYLVYFIVVQRQPADPVEPSEGPVVKDGDVVLAEVEVVQLSQVSEGHRGDVLQLIV